MDYNKIDENKKKSLMIHWFHYYGKSIYTFGELEQFTDLLDTDMDSVVTYAMMLYLENKGPSSLLEQLRANRLDSILEVSRDHNNSSNEQVQHDINMYRNIFFETINETFEKPLPSVPMDPKVMSKQIQDIINKK